MRKPIACALALLAAFIPGCSEPEPSPGLAVLSAARTGDPDTDYDVVVVGAGSGGVAAAIQAARSGARVLLLEETDWIGGQMTAAGVSSMDGPFYPHTHTGIYAEFAGRIRDYYERRVRHRPKSIGTCYFQDSRVCFEPKVGQQILHEMLAETDNVHLFLRRSVTAVIEAGSSVTGVRLAGGSRIDCRILIDATEYGDVIPLTSARYRVGNSFSDDIDHRACIQDITYSVHVRDYGSRMPEELRIDREPPGYREVRDRFRSFVNRGGSGGERAGGRAPRPWSWNHHNRYRGTPDSTNPRSYTGTQPGQITRTAINFANDFPGSVVEQRGGETVHLWLGQLGVDYLENLDVRRRQNCEAKLLTIQFLYYMQNELGASRWSVSDDQGYDTPYNREENNCALIPEWLKPIERHMPVMPYVRESRRIVPLRTLAAPDIQRDPDTRVALRNLDTAVALGDYGMDLHNCSDGWMLDAGDTPGDSQRGAGPFQIPFEALIPERLGGFVAAEKNIGVSRLVSGATRLQPVTMLTGQAAGVIAASAVRRGIEPRDLRRIDVQRELLDAGSNLSLSPFDDVPQESGSWSAVQLVNVHQIMNGYSSTRFAPRENITRVQMALTLVRLLGLDTTGSPASPSFVDVPTSHPAYAAVEAIYREGITTGCRREPRSFCPTQAVTRAQVAIFLARALSLSPLSPGAESTFDDVPTSHPASDEIQRVVREGILHGCAPPDRFCPDAPATRAQTAIAISRVLARE